jgi:hypothetical protein
MKEDVLEQIVDDYLQLKGYFTIHNVKFKPSSDHPHYVATEDRVASDVDVVGLHPTKRGVDRVWVVSCKAWQSGFDADRKLKELRREVRNPKRATWRYFRELWVPKWAEAFRDEIQDRTNATKFRYSIAVTKLKGDARAWNADSTISSNLAGNPFSFLTLETMWTEYLESIGTTPQPSAIGRLAQLLKAAGVDTATSTSDHIVRSAQS